MKQHNVNTMDYKNFDKLENDEQKYLKLTLNKHELQIWSTDTSYHEPWITSIFPLLQGEEFQYTLKILKETKHTQLSSLVILERKLKNILLLTLETSSQIDHRVHQKLQTVLTVDNTVSEEVCSKMDQLRVKYLSELTTKQWKPLETGATKVTVFSDRSADNNRTKVGYGVVIKTTKRKTMIQTNGRVTDDQTNRKAEILATYIAMKLYANINEVTLVSNSEYNINMHTKWEDIADTKETWFKKENTDTIQANRRENEEREKQGQMRIQFHWVQSHTGKDDINSKENEETDHHAKRKAKKQLQINYMEKNWLQTRSIYFTKGW